MDENPTDVVAEAEDTVGAETPEEIVTADAPEQVAAEDEQASPITFGFSQSVVVLSDPSSAEAEAIAALRTHLLAHHVRAGRRGLAICSPNAKSGTTFVAANLAVSLARAGIRTLLIDANLRKPAMHRMIVPSREMPALSDCLSDSSIAYGSVIQEEVMPSLSVIYAGGRNERAQELLAGASFKSLVDLCMRDFEVTIIDTPPSNNSSDARRIASIVRHCVVVARKDVSYVSDIKTLIDELKSDKVNVIGTVLNEF
ncbi:CpsD/CapB family tyrosine-protein kinase [Novosphingobium mangrovi (ex Huang et al. 2023)]|uniref:CpsD/CapB family tyrosine-protein kinase n=1 Tax=Novosphingobium mangrovi (ex Huang et al. 2023) TaxID=2976432 RepID=A0ABT2I0T0_9SPHN|nr:CpsD/CapB family tyrosine-protein kinase [Novosphingobium mangrovi (ex Huang et al. 2023)]MCT2398406.1 CpsD/CapB family tyrosine-protein kinase [Novosphingobium mangrovi (ex Huang et al. 2023)]